MNFNGADRLRYWTDPHLECLGGVMFSRLGTAAMWGAW